MPSDAPKPVIVGIDGSAQAENAAMWAMDEALHRGVPVRLISVIRTDLTGPLTAEEYESAVSDAKDALRAVQEAANRANRPVEIATSIEQGSPAGVLLTESADAEMICLGATGMGRIGRAILGSTATAVARDAECSVVIVPCPRTEPPADTDTSWVIVAVSVYTANGSDVIEDAVAEARRNGWPVLAVGVRRPELGSTPPESLDEIVSRWRRRFPDVHVYPVATDSGLTEFLHSNPDVGGLVVLDEAHSPAVEAIVDSQHHRGRQPAERAVLIARHRVSHAVA
jgi:nucleotide-binding universal stress UspA family protein